MNLQAWRSSVDCDIYDLQEERAEGRLLNMLNPDQRIIFDAVTEKYPK